MNTVQPDVILQKLEEFCDKYPTFTKAAKALNITSAQLSLTRNSRTNVIPERVLKKLGYASKLVYVPLDGKKATPPKKAGGTPKKAKSTPKAKPVRKSDIASKKVKIAEKPAQAALLPVNPTRMSDPSAANIISVRG